SKGGHAGSEGRVKRRQKAEGKGTDGKSSGAPDPKDETVKAGPDAANAEKCKPKKPVSRKPNPKREGPSYKTGKTPESPGGERRHHQTR
ncbi:hypothetical protein, partial [Streptomyces flavofungini]|uniref:hypothetical protein n=1 Tax=Streptomyces flavofungini TaxID=68200 RepID=UPI0034DEA2AA